MVGKARGGVLDDRIFYLAWSLNGIGRRGWYSPWNRSLIWLGVSCYLGFVVGISGLGGGLYTGWDSSDFMAGVEQLILERMGL